jgi:hypothetical protein
MGAFVITGCIIIATFVLFVWYIRITKPDHKKKLKIVHRAGDQLHLFV